jgi:conjugative transfer signal peptidase TraF
LTSQHRRRRLGSVIAWAIIPCAACAALAAVIPQPSILWNASPSEPTGLYIRAPLAPLRGRMIAFRAPAPAFPYADERMGYLHRIPILKQIAAGEGDTVCANQGGLTIDGRWRAPVFDRDSRGRPLPHWSGCRLLARGEFFVFSDRIPNSFDSRYFGPVERSQIVGVFQPLATSSSLIGVS